MLIEMQLGGCICLGEDRILILLSVEEDLVQFAVERADAHQTDSVTASPEPPFQNDEPTFRGHASSSQDEVGGTPSGLG